ncbi:hypothetical protein JN11_01048 [Mucilaginibacter frigoritolerans]|uniref:Uncharacterized protein n=1 Tax=Mucilaginibacter frigoritolerans TaxID=652788 RepID=A0A562UCF7_9SPHI|nr:hypothetical protein JN11_01048 [Mucilaginibacter frigoritolerans]
MKQTLIYSLNVWLTSVVAAPLLFLIFTLPKNTGIGIEILPFEWLMGGVLSVPSFLLLYLTSNYLVRLRFSILIDKIILSLVGILLTYIPFFLINGYHLILDGDQLSQPLFICYSCATVICLWFYKFNPPG